MFCKIIKPSVPLQSFVKDILLLRFDLDASASSPVKAFPANIDPAIVFYITGDLLARNISLNTETRFAKIAINGSQLSRFDFHLPKNFFIVSVNFQPHALSLFLQEPITEFVDQRIDGQSVLGNELNMVHDAIENAPTNEHIILILESYLLKRINRLKKGFSPLEKLILTISESKSLHSIEEWASMACLSISQFERKFIQLMGITPKLFIRINRFNKAYTLKDKSPDLDWLQVAIDSGYHDYQHLVRDFKQFSCTTPNSLLLQQSTAPDKIFR